MQKHPKQLYWNHTSAWVFSCKLAAYSENTFSYEHVSAADPDYIHFCKCSSHIYSDKIIKKYRNTRFLLQIILFFS